MNKRDSVTTTAGNNPDYPDVLGTVTKGKRVAVDVLFVAVGSRPATIKAGQSVEVLVLLQNAVNIDVDAVLKVTTPEKDLAGQKNRFSTITKALRIGLLPGEVGYVSLPITTTAQVKQGAYIAQIEIQIEQKARGAARVRNANGGSRFYPDRLPGERQALLAPLNSINYVQQGKVNGAKAIIEISFEVGTTSDSSTMQATKPNYISLWTTSDYSGEVDTEDDFEAQIESDALPINRMTLFFPILKSLQDRFEDADFRLWAGEAVAIAKLMTYALEAGIKTHGDVIPGAETQRWYTKLRTMLVQDPKSIEPLAHTFTEILFADLVYDSAMLGFSLLNRAIHEDFGTLQEMSDFAEDLVARLTERGEALDLTHAYLPLVLGGIIASSQVSMPDEHQRDTVVLISSARKERAHQQDSGNEFVFEMADNLLSRA